MIAVYADDWQGRRTSQEDIWFGGKRYKREHFTQVVADLKATKFKKFTTTSSISALRCGAIDPSWGAREAYQARDWFDSNWDGVQQQRRGRRVDR